MKNIKSSSSVGLPIVALIGPTNAGKSTLFNRLTGSWQAITAKEESTTRDRVYGEVEWQGNRFTVVDTGGLVQDPTDLYQKIKQQTLQAVEEADLILFVYDGREGLQPNDQQFLDKLRGKKNIWLIANKIDTSQLEKVASEPTYLGFPVHKIAAATGRGTGDLLEDVCNFLPSSQPIAHQLPVIALIGRPNVGKSTLLNALTKTDRAVVSPIAGTTRDIVSAKLTLGKNEFLLADTAGVRRSGKIEVGVEKFSVRRTLQAIQSSNAVIVLVDATEGTTRGDLHLIYYANQLKIPVLVVFNKTDLVEDKEKVRFHHHLAKFDRILASALTGEGIEQVSTWLLESATNKS